MPITISQLPDLIARASQEGIAARQQAAESDRAEKERALRQLLQGQKEGTLGADGKYSPGTDSSAEQAKIKATHAADLDSQNQAIDRAQQVRNDLNRSAPGHKYNVGISKEGASISEADQLPRDNTANKRLEHSDRRELSKRYESLSDFNSSIRDIERLSNQDGKGGILSNPAAQLPGTGKVESAIPDMGLGLAEMTGVVPKGTSEMRKALSRVQLGYARALGGARGVNPAMMAKEKEAMGYLASGDPELVKKGVLSLAGAVRDHYQTIQGGFDASTRDAVHADMGGDPTSAYSALPQAGPAGAPIHAAPQAAPAQASQVAPQAAPQAPSMSFEDFKARKAAGKL